MSFTQLLEQTELGLYCPMGDCFIDPWRPVDTALITHAHADHARWGHGHYVAAEAGKLILAERVGHSADIKVVPYNIPFKQGNIWVTFYPAGHILGSAQVGLEYKDTRIVISGDYKRCQDNTCEPFQPVPCTVFITEATFALPIYQWPSLDLVVKDILAWWQTNALRGKTSVLFCYSLGKAQRILSALAPFIPTNSPLPFVYCHPSTEALNQQYRLSGVKLPPTLVTPEAKSSEPILSRALILAPPSCQHNGWLKRYKLVSTAFASGWMTLRAARKQRQVDRGFVISDHTDWPGLLRTIEETSAKHVWITHGRTDVLARYLLQKGIDAKALHTLFGQEDDE